MQRDQCDLTVVCAPQIHILTKSLKALEEATVGISVDCTCDSDSDVAEKEDEAYVEARLGSTTTVSGREDKEDMQATWRLKPLVRRVVDLTMELNAHVSG